MSETVGENCFEPPPFHAVLQPNRSLSRTGFAIVMALLAGASFMVGTVFLLMGAWPVFGFLGLDVALVYLAFRLSYRSGRLYETVDLANGQLDIARIHPDGKREFWSLPAYWVRVELTRYEYGACELELVSHGRRVMLARFLSPSEIADFAGALKKALSFYKAH